MPILRPALLALTIGLAGCQSMLDQQYQKSLPTNQGMREIQGLLQPVSIRRNELGMPLIEAGNLHDGLFAMGYVHASDRISQMTGMRLLADGRLSELVGPATLQLDILLRSLDLRSRARQMLSSASPEVRERFAVYARGVNAWLYRHRDRLPLDLSSAGYQPEYWQAEDSALLLCLMEFGLAVNLQEEIAGLRLAGQVGSKRLGWLLPVYPDEPLPHDEAAKLADLQLEGELPQLTTLERTAGQLTNLHMLGVAASNNWAFAPQRSAAAPARACWPTIPTCQSTSLRCGLSCTCAPRSSRWLACRSPAPPRWSPASMARSPGA